MQISLFNKKSNQLLGIDVGSSSLKLVELAKAGRGVQVVSAGVHALPPETVVEGRIEKPEEMALVVRRAVTMARTKTKHVAVAVPGSAVITRVLDMPAELSEDEMEIQLLMEAEQYIPYSLEEVAVDFTTIEIQESGENETAKVLLAACRKESIEALTGMLEMAELEAKVVDVEPFCLERVYPYLAEHLEEDSDALIAVVDCGATTLRVNVLDKGSTVYSRDEMFGTKQLMEEIMRRYGLSAEEAMAAERDGDLPGDYEQEVLAPFRDSLVQQISRSLQFFYSSTSYSQLDTMILAGGIVSGDALAKMTEARIEVPVVAANPFKTMSLGSGIRQSELEKIAPSLLIATGLALRGVS